MSFRLTVTAPGFDRALDLPDGARLPSAVVAFIETVARMAPQCRIRLWSVEVGGSFPLLHSYQRKIDHRFPRLRELAEEHRDELITMAARFSALRSLLDGSGLGSANEHEA